MKIYNINILLMILISSLFEQAQGKSVLNDGKSLENKDFPLAFEIQSAGKSLDSRSLNNRTNALSAEERSPLDITKSYEDVDDNHYYLPPVTSDIIAKRYIVNLMKSNIKTNSEDMSIKLKPTRNLLKAAKFPDLENSSSKTTNIIYKNHHSQNVFCRQIMKSELNSQGNIIDSVQHICDPLPLTTTSIKTSFRQKLKPNTSPNFPHPHKEKRFERLVSSTPSSGFNCRRIMNSELNERGEIVDSVTEVCDPPTTTTTTTRRPRMTTTTKASTTTPKPLMEICRPVMNSYLSEQGEIIDSVTMVCKMEKFN